MQETISINGVKILVNKSPWLKKIAGISDDTTLQILCPEGTTDEEIIRYVYEKFPMVINKPKEIKKKRPRIGSAESSAKAVSALKDISSSEETHKEKPKIKCVVDNPWSVFSKETPVVKERIINKVDTKPEIISIVKNSKGYRINYNYHCAYCGKSHFKGYEYSFSNGRDFVIYDFCRGDILQHKGWIHEISTNIGHGK